MHMSNGSLYVFYGGMCVFLTLYRGVSDLLLCIGHQKSLHVPHCENSEKVTHYKGTTLCDFDSFLT